MLRLGYEYHWNMIYLYNEMSCDKIKVWYYPWQLVKNPLTIENN